jgi:predicted kinase
MPKTKLTADQIRVKIKELTKKHNQRIKALKAQYEKAVIQEEAARTDEQDADILAVYNNIKHRNDWEEGERAWIWHDLLGEVNYVPIEAIR